MPRYHRADTDSHSHSHLQAFRISGSPVNLHVCGRTPGGSRGIMQKITLHHCVAFVIIFLGVFLLYVKKKKSKLLNDKITA